ncbi:uncharacterized protein Z519_08255 [Cladophialophora bantiana CBS 173.52]|uniref:Uncharacterized protein n=1 Tax=Cladophialophora bantiana (strain ATCC 10958 / CBS 173.52 / CDC B-1940 / NIH 8579) TaxID=1442370 RepID=A0A0D2I377_CLAB1|nr:uncharacterized protein Z519_08255 [Cladophialophora bantiana CBS 173.52]KIW91359.1 hypothetical protein Z519_08255 [Cladophialophora bantiana CBS 173.52]
MKNKACRLNDLIGSSVNVYACPGFNVHGQIVVRNFFGHHMDFSQNGGIMNNNPPGNFGARILNTQMSNPLNGGYPLQHPSMRKPNHRRHNTPDMGSSHQHHPVGLPYHMPQNSTANWSPVRHYPMGMANLTPQHVNANGSHLGTQQAGMPSNMPPNLMIADNLFANEYSQILGSVLQFPVDGSSTIPIHGERMTNAMTSFNDGYFTENDHVGMQGLLAQDVMSDNDSHGVHGNFFPQEQVYLDPAFTGFESFNENISQGVPVIPQGHQDTAGERMWTQELVSQLRAALQTSQDKISLLEEEHGRNVATLRDRVTALEKENATLKRENVMVKSFYNMIRGYYDFTIGPNGKLFPVIPTSNQSAVVQSDRPKPVFQEVYEAKMERMQRQYQRVLVKADICLLCPLHHSSRQQLQPPQMVQAPAQVIDLTNEEPGPSGRQGTIQEFLAGAARYDIWEGCHAATQTTVALGAATPARLTTTAGTASAASSAPSIPPTRETAAAHAASSRPSATTSAKRPAPPVTLPAPAEDVSPSKRQKRKQSDYAWMQQTQNLALRKATGDLPHPLEGWDPKRVAAAAAGHLGAVAVNTAVSTAPAANHPSSSLPPKPAPAPQSTSSYMASKVTQPKPAAAKSNPRAKGKEKAQSSAASLADLTKALSGPNTARPAVPNTSDTTLSSDALSVDILPEEPTYVPARRPTLQLPPTAPPTDMDSESETEERAARIRNYDLMVIDHNEQSALPDNSEGGRISPFEPNDDDVADLVALFEASEESDNQQKGAPEANQGENWDNADRLFGEKEFQVMLQDEESEVSEEE